MYKEQECCLFNEFEQAGYISLSSKQRCCTIFQYLTVALLSLNLSYYLLTKESIILRQTVEQCAVCLSCLRCFIGH